MLGRPSLAFLLCSTALLLTDIVLASPAPASVSSVVSLPPPANVLGRADEVRPIARRDSYEGFDDPQASGGYMLTIVPDTYPAGLGEPLNMIISSASDSAVLVNSKDDGGFLNWALSLNFSGNCLGAVNSGGQAANLGDGQGNTTQLDEIRFNFGDIYFGTCRETFEGGNHFRYWKQNTTGAIFMAVSEEKDLSNQHDIIYNGYNLGRDDLVSIMTGVDIPARNVTNTTVYEGSSTYMNYTYQNHVQYMSGILKNSSDGINHYLTVEENGFPAIDGLVAVVTVKITGYPEGEGPGSSAGLRGVFLPSVSVLVASTLALTLWTTNLL